METNEAYPEIITSTINAFVDRIEQVLLSRGTARAERTSICSEVETQIHLLIERKLESSSELTLELVTGILESMDPPESYGAMAEPIAFESTAKPDETSNKTTAAERKVRFANIRKLLHIPKRTTPAIDWVAIGSLVAISMGLFLFVLALFSGHRGREGFVVGGFFMVFCGSIASAVSFWRIQHSNGLLTGQRLASALMIALPFFLVNALLCAILFATPIGYVLGAILMFTALVYANYRVIRHAIGWLGAYSVKVSEADLKPSELKNDATEVSGTILEAGA